MTLREYPQYDPKDVKSWLEAVFGKGIIFDTQHAKNFRDRSDRSDNVLGAWMLYYTGEVFVQADLPPGDSRLLADSLRDSLEAAIVAQLVPQWWQTPIQDRKKAIRESGWPLPEDVVRGGINIDTGLLKDLAARLEKPAKYPHAFAGEVQQREAAWIEHNKRLLRRCYAAFIGREPGKDDMLFRYGTAVGWHSGMELSFQFPAPWPPVFPGGDTFTSRDWQNHWAQRGKQLGLDGAFQYEDFHYGTHAPLEEQKLVLIGHNDHDLTNKLDHLLDPKNLPKVQTYFNEVLGTSLTKIWLNERHPDFSSEAQKIWNRIKGRSADAMAKREQAFETLGNQEKFRRWGEVVPNLIETHPTLAGFIKAVHGPAPEGQDDIFRYLRKWSDKAFPLLTKTVTEGKFKPVLAPAGAERPKPKPASPAVT